VFWKPCSSCWSFHILQEEFLSAPIHTPHSLVTRSVLQDHNISFYQLRNADNLVVLFRIPMTRAAFNELILLQDFLAHLGPLDHLSNDH
jgi:hypothetical protein